MSDRKSTKQALRSNMSNVSPHVEIKMLEHIHTYINTHTHIYIYAEIVRYIWYPEKDIPIYDIPMINAHGFIIFFRCDILTLRQLYDSLPKCQWRILSWSWLNIWFEPMRWPVLGHVTGINSATTTCQPRPANHDPCVSLAFEIIRKRSLMLQYASKWRDYKVFDMETHILLTF